MEFGYSIPSRLGQECQNYPVWYCNCGYMTPCICQNSENFMAQRMTLKVCKLTKTHLGGWGSSDWMQNVTRQSNCMTNVRNNVLEKVGKGADLNNIGNDWSL